MNKQLAGKLVFIGVLILFALIVLIPPNQTLRAGIDLAGGTSLIYEIDTTDIPFEDRKGLSARMIDVLRRRVDPGNIRNLIWRPQGDTRFEIQMPLASAEVRAKRLEFENAQTALQAENINPALILQAVKLPAEKRVEIFNKITSGNANKIEILNKIAKTSDDYSPLREQREKLYKDLGEFDEKIKAAGLDANTARSSRYSWSISEPNKRQGLLRTFISPKDANLADTGKVALLNEYVKIFSSWSAITEQLNDPNNVIVIEYKKSQQDIDKLNLSGERINTILAIENKYTRRDEIDKLKKEFPERSGKIDAVVKAWEAYKPFQGRLDDPKDLQRMLKGAGILEFRILPTKSSQAEVDKAAAYIDRLRINGPSYVSATDNEYIWIQAEKPDEMLAKDRAGNYIIDVYGMYQTRWADEAGNSVFAGKFGDKWYVLASNKPEQCMLRNPEKPWSLVKSLPTRDEEGRRAISFQLDPAGGRMMSGLSYANVKMPLCILLDSLAISAPYLRSQIGENGIITGSFTEAEQFDFVNKLNAGSLPARLIEPPISERTIGPSIGADNLEKGIKSGLIGVCLVVLGMMVYYTVGGAIADAAMFLNLLFTLAIMAFLNATFTLPGIAGLILTIGMSVDANVLIFERMREEFAKGSSMRTAIKNGYEKAFSAIFDSNLTTVISAVVLYYVGSEDIKGFAIVLMLGLLSNLFTAVFVTRVIFDFLVAKGILKEKMIMLKLIRRPNINWMAYRPVFFTISAVLTIGGLIFFFTRDPSKSNKYDIEFTGGTSIVVNIKPDSQLTRQDVENKIKQVGTELGNPAIATSSVWSIGQSIGDKGGEKIYQQYEITTSETNKSIVRFSFAAERTISEQTIVSKISERLPDASVAAVSGQKNVFEISSAQTNTDFIINIIKDSFPEVSIGDTQVQQIVNEAVIKSLANDMQLLQNLSPRITSAVKIDEKLIEAEPQLANFLGGIKITCEIQTDAAAEQITSRIKDLAFKPEMQRLTGYNFKVFGGDLSEPAEKTGLKSFVFVSINPNFAYRQPSDEEWKAFEDNERARVSSAMQLSESLPRVTQISPSVGSEAKTRAVLAVTLSLFAMLVYIWLRFGGVRYGLGAVVKLFHDTCITLGIITSAYYISKTAIGQMLLIGDFKINLAMIAAILTLIGYSINDSIVIFDRIRENRKRGLLTPQLISDSINDCMSRTLLTGTTTLMVVWIMYIFGGEGLRGFNYALGLGILIGTYSSIAISAPLLLLARHAKGQENKPKI